MASLKFLAVLLIFICALSSVSASCSSCCNDPLDNCDTAYNGGPGYCCNHVFPYSCCSSILTCGSDGTCTPNYVGMTIGAIIAIIIGSIVGCILLCALFVWLITRQQRTTTIITQGTPVYAT